MCLHLSSKETGEAETGAGCQVGGRPAVFWGQRGDTRSPSPPFHSCQLPDTDVSGPQRGRLNVGASFSSLTGAKCAPDYYSAAVAFLPVIAETVSLSYRIRSRSGLSSGVPWSRLEACWQLSSAPLWWCWWSAAGAMFDGAPLVCGMWSWAC